MSCERDLSYGQAGAWTGDPETFTVSLQYANRWICTFCHKSEALYVAAFEKDTRCTLQWICFGAVIDQETIKKDKTELLQPISDRLKLLRKGNRIGKSLLSDEERRFMWNLAFLFTWKYRVAAFKAYYAIRSFITFHGIFMGPGYDLGDGSVWRKN